MKKDNVKLFSLRKNQTDFPNVKIGGSQDAADFIRRFYLDDIEIYESFYLLCLNRANKTIGYVKISQGGITGTVTDLRIILKYAIESLATSCMVAHNHPSGNLQPSESDITITRRIKEAMQIMDISLIDHILLTSEGFYSFADEGII